MITPQSQYWYDALNRLLKATGRELSSLNAPCQNDFVNNLPVPSGSDMQNYTHHYSYDALGNIQSVQSTGGNGWTRTYNYNTINNYLTSTQVGQDTSAYTYDKHGNIVTMPHLPQMEWDYADRMKKTLCGTVNTWYCYDIQGERVRKVTEKQGGITEERIYLNGYEVYRKYISGEIDTERQSLNILDIKPLEEGEDEEKQTKLVFNHNKKITLAETKTIADGEGILIPTTLIRYQYDNNLGSACLELDASAAIISYEEYHPFGTTSYRSGRNETEVSLKRYKYVGKERDEETGFYYYGARYYAAWLCVWASVDPLAEERKWLSPYNYCQLNPVMRKDPDGALDGEGDDPTKKLPSNGDIAQKAAEKAGVSDNWFTQFATGFLNQTPSWSTPFQLISDRYESIKENPIRLIGPVDIYYSLKNDYKVASNTISGAASGNPYTMGVFAGALFTLWAGGKAAGNNTLTTSEGFLLKEFSIKAPFNIPVQRFGNMSIGRPDYWSVRIGKGKLVNRTFNAIKPKWNPLTQYTKGVIPKGTTIRVGIVGPQGFLYPGGSVQIIINSKYVKGQYTIKLK